MGRRAGGRAVGAPHPTALLPLGERCDALFLPPCLLHTCAHTEHSPMPLPQPWPCSPSTTRATPPSGSRSAPASSPSLSSGTSRWVRACCCCCAAAQTRCPLLLLLLRLWGSGLKPGLAALCCAVLRRLSLPRRAPPQNTHAAHPGAPPAVFYSVWTPFMFLVGYTDPRRPGGDKMYGEAVQLVVQQAVQHVCSRGTAGWHAAAALGARSSDLCSRAGCGERCPPAHHHVTQAGPSTSPTLTIPCLPAEWFFRSSLDRYIWIYGMICAFMHPK